MLPLLSEGNMKTILTVYVLLSGGWMPFISIPVESKAQCEQAGRESIQTGNYKVGNEVWRFKDMKTKYECKEEK